MRYPYSSKNRLILQQCIILTFQNLIFMQCLVILNFMSFLSISQILRDNSLSQSKSMIKFPKVFREDRISITSIWERGTTGSVCHGVKNTKKYERFLKGRFLGNRKDNLQKAERTELNQNFASKHLQYPYDWKKISVI